MRGLPASALVVMAIMVFASGISAREARGNPPKLPADLRVGASAVNLHCDDDMVLAGMLEPRYTKEQEGQLRAVAIVIEKPGQAKLAIVACDVLWVPRDLADRAVAEIEKTTGIPAAHVLINATHTHHAPSTAPAHGFGVSEKFREEVRSAIVRSVQEANVRCRDGDSLLFFHLGEEKTVGANSRLLLPDGNITWINPQKESDGKGKPTGPFDAQLPMLDFRDPAGKSRAVLFNHSTHTIGTRLGRDCRSPSFYGLAAQELEQEIGATVSFLEGASGSTHNVTQVPVAECVERMKLAVRDARSKAETRPVARLAGIRRTLKFRVRKFDDVEEDAKIARYTTKYTPQASNRIREIFAAMRKQLEPKQGEERETWVQAVVIGDVALVGVPAEYFTALGVDIKRRSPFKNTFVAELANDWIGYLPDREGHRLGGYQTWMGLHSYAEVGTGERVADLAVSILQELAANTPVPSAANGAASPATAGNHKSSATAVRAPDSAADEHQSFHLADPQLTIELVAAEPDIESPVAIAWDADGRLYVAEMSGYPETPGLGRVKQLIDADADGVFETSSIFADGLNFPASVMPIRNGLLVADAPDILLLNDTDGDGRADDRKRLWTGFHTGSQQLRANSLHWGLDNWVYGANGRCDGEIVNPDRLDSKTVSIRGRDFRFRPDMTAFEAITGQSQFGQAHDDWGNRFLSWNTIPVRQALIDGRYLNRRLNLSSVAVADLASSDDTGRVFGISPAPRQFNAERADHYNAMCGLTIFRGDGLGADYAGDAFVGESLANLVTRRRLRPDGSTFVSERTAHEIEFLASSDSWFHPVNLAVGPDGCLYVVDFYRELVEHPLYVGSPELRQRVDWRHGHGHGRLWRVRKKDFHVPANRRRIALSAAPAEQLVNQLSHPVGWWRDTAQRLLVERKESSAVLAVRGLLLKSTIPVARLHALRTLEGLGVLTDADLVAALHDADPHLRRQAWQMAEPRWKESRSLRAACLEQLGEIDPQVRFQMALSLGNLPDAPPAAFVQLVESSRNDSRTMLAALSSANTSTDEVVRELVRRDPAWFAAPSESQFEFLRRAGELVVNPFDARPITEIVEWAARWHTADSSGTKSSIHLAETASSLAPGALVFVAGIIDALSNEGRRAAIATTRPDLAALIVRSARRFALDSKCSAALHEAAAQVLATATPQESLEALRTLLKTSTAGSVQSAAARVIAGWSDAEAIRRIYADDWPQLSGSARRAILSASMRHGIAMDVLLTAIEGKQLLPVELPLDVDATLRRATDARVSERVARVLGAAQSSDRTKVVEQLRPALALSGDRQRGAAVFRQNCLTCHSVQGFGRRVGPDLSGIGARPVESLLVDLLDPSRQVSPDYVAYALVMRDGRVQSGLIASDTPTTITLRQAEGQEFTVARGDIEELRATGKSLMPDGIEQKVDAQGLADLLAFLRSPDRNLLKVE